jgi:hypothetical protein
MMDEEEGDEDANGFGCLGACRRCCSISNMRTTNSSGRFREVGRIIRSDGSANEEHDDAEFHGMTV